MEVINTILKKVTTLMYMLLISFVCIGITIFIGVYLLKLSKEATSSTSRGTSPLTRYDTVDVSVTTYNMEVRQTDNSPNITASMEKILEKEIISRKCCAVSRDLIYEKLNFGDTIELIGSVYQGKYIVKDIMNERFYRAIDILLPKGQVNISAKGKIRFKTF
jgi:hypothetical protein